MPAFLIGSIGVIAETSHLQRAAFNQAFDEAGLGWHWTEDAYREMLTSAGGKQRIAAFAQQRDLEVDADAVHVRKGEIFRDMLAQGITPRAGVTDTLQQTRQNGWKLGFVSATSPENVEAILSATGIARDAFDIVTSRADAEHGKPAPDIYLHALRALGCDAKGSIAIEDNPDGVAAAKSAGLTCFAFPGALHSGSDFSRADLILDRLAPADATQSP